MEKLNPTKVVTTKSRPVRFSYVQVFTPSSVEEGGTKKYSLSIIIDKEDKATLKMLEDGIQAAIKAGKDKKFGGKVPKNLKLPLRDGDEEREDQEEYAGSMFLNASTTRRPAVKDSDMSDILDEEEFYSGCYGQVSLNFYAFNTSGNKGVAAGLNHVRKLEDGERLGAAVSSAEDDFGDDDDMLG